MIVVINTQLRHQKYTSHIAPILGKTQTFCVMSKSLGSFTANNYNIFSRQVDFYLVFARDIDNIDVENIQAVLTATIGFLLLSKLCGLQGVA